MRQPLPAGAFACMYGPQTMQIEPEVLTEHTELICSTNIGAGAGIVRHGYIRSHEDV